MSKLFIIGNGFDLAHKIPSRYEDFRLYLISLLSQRTNKVYTNYDFSVNNDIITYNYKRSLENDILTIMYFLSNAEEGTQWNNIEDSMGRLNYDDFSYLFIKEDEHEERANDSNKQIFEPYQDVLMSIPDYFSDWIKKIKLNKNNKKYISSKLSSLFDDKSKFLCFNYTDSLEYLYGIKRENICYIHGKAKEGSKLQFGHGYSRKYEDYLEGKDINWLSTADGEYMIDRNLRKPANKILKKNSLFFESIKDVDEVYSFGFSYGYVDKPYIKAILKKIDINAKWFIDKFPSDKEKKEYKKIIEECGYAGIVEEF